MQEIKLNEGQQEGITTFLGFLMSDDKECHLIGPAGVGKTFLMGYMHDHVLEDYRNACKLMDMPMVVKEVAFTATTNKAAEVLAKQINKPTSTIHSYLNLRVVNNYNTGESTVEKTRSYVVRHNILIFIDEASMTDRKLRDIILESFVNSKIVWVSDDKQLAPVFEKESSIYKNRENQIVLTQPVRNAGQPALMALCQQMRDTVSTGNFKPIAEVPGVIEYLDDAAMSQKVREILLDPNHNARILCYTNNRVNTYNGHVRYIRNLPDHFCVGEHLVVGTAYHSGEQGLSVEEPVEVLESRHDNIITETLDGQQFTVYQLVIRNMFGERMVVKVPADPEHFDKLQRWFKSQKKWRSYYAMQERYADLRPCDAATVYKAQGSTYETAFMDLSDISTCNDAEQTARMLYVGVSRPTTRLYLYGKLKEKYGG